MQLYDIENISLNDQRNHYANKQEIMAYAWQITYQFKIKGKSKEDTKVMLQSKNKEKFKYSEILERYHKLFSTNNSVIKLLYKYMYLYLD